MRGHSVRVEALGALNATWDFHGTSLRVATQPQMIAMLATHASGELFSSRLLRLVELVLVIRKDDERDPLDWAAVTEHLRSANALRFAYPAFTLVERLAPGTIDERALGARRCCTMRGARSRRMGCGGLGQRGRDMPA